MGAKKSETGKSSNRIRFIMLDADISDGNFSELTHAITSALKPSAPIRQLPQISQPPTAQSATAEPVIDEVGRSAEPQEVNGEEDAKTSREAKPRHKPALPEYLHDMDVQGDGTAFKVYADEKAPKKHVKRYLLVAMWLKQHGGGQTVNVNQVYTCYRTAGWPLGMSDWDATFRQLVKRDLMRRVEAGVYAITPLGEATLQEPEE